MCLVHFTLKRRLKLPVPVADHTVDRTVDHTVTGAGYSSAGNGP